MTMSSTNQRPKQPDLNLASPARAERRWRDILTLAGLSALVLAGLLAMAATVGWEETRAQLSRLSLWQFLILLGLSLINYFFRGMRWHLFTRKLGLPTHMLQDLRHFLGGFAMSVTPGRVGELVRMRWLRRETGWSFERTAPLVLMDRASDLASMALILGLSVSMSAAGIAGALPVTFLALAAAVVATRPRLLAGLVTFSYRLTGKAPRLFARFRGAARSLKHFSSPDVMIPALALGLIGWSAEGYAFDLLLNWMGADIGFFKAVAIFVFATLAGGLTGAPGGVGGAEAAIVALLAMEGVPLEISLPATVIIRVTTLWFAILIGLAVFPIAERYSRKD